MNVITESVFVGLYTTFLAFVLKPFIKNKYLFLFILGFMKHFLGYYLYIQTIYCKLKDKELHLNFSRLLIQCIMEGIAFVCIGISIGYTSMAHIFLLGMFIHLYAETLFVHYYFCK